MDAQELILVAPELPAVELDLIADLACPWSYMGKRSLERALGNLYGAPVRALRWHGLPLAVPGQPVGWREHLARRLPAGVGIEFAERALAEAGRELGIAFAFERLQQLPDTREAHRLVGLAAREGRHSETADALFAAFFEQARDIGDRGVLEAVAAECGLTPEARAAFRDPAEGRDAVGAEEQRLRGLGVTAVPNLLINGRVLVPGPADVSTYVQALDQALIPEASEPRDRRLLH